MTQVVPVAAGAGGMGLALARASATDGARVHIADVDAEAVQEIARPHSAISGPFCDIGTATDLEPLFREMQDRLCGLDVLVDNAGIAGFAGGAFAGSPARCGPCRAARAAPSRAAGRRRSGSMQVADEVWQLAGQRVQRPAPPRRSTATTAQIRHTKYKGVSLKRS